MPPSIPVESTRTSALPEHAWSIKTPFTSSAVAIAATPASRPAIVRLLLRVIVFPFLLLRQRLEYYFRLSRPSTPARAPPPPTPARRAHTHPPAPILRARPRAAKPCPSPRASDP